MQTGRGNAPLLCSVKYKIQRIEKFSADLSVTTKKISVDLSVTNKFLRCFRHRGLDRIEGEE